MDEGAHFPQPAASCSAVGVVVEECQQWQKPSNFTFSPPWSRRAGDNPSAYH